MTRHGATGRRIATSHRGAAAPIAGPVAAFLAVLIAGTATAAAAAGGDAPAGLLRAPRVFRAAVERVQRSIVTIETVGGVMPSGVRRGSGPLAALAHPGEGPTTGLIVSADGHILTSTYNFIRNPQVITVTLPDGSRHVAERLGQDQTRNICVLKIDSPPDLAVAEHADPNALRVGQWAISVGVGYGGQAPAVSVGVISALARIGGRAVQTDANLSPANYGGPLIDIHGRAIGLCVPLTPRSGGPGAGSEWYDSGIGFAVPVRGIDHIIERLKDGQTLRRGYIGIAPSPEPVAGGGVRIGRVAPGSPVDRADIEPGDVITHVDGHRVRTPAAALRRLGRYVAGDTVRIKVRSGDESRRELDITLQTGPFRPKPDETPGKAPDGNDPDTPIG